MTAEGDGIPTVNLNDKLNKQPAKKAAKNRAKPKTKAKPKAKGKAKQKKSKPASKKAARTRLDQVPAELAPPQIMDNQRETPQTRPQTRLVPVPGADMEDLEEVPASAPEVTKPVAEVPRPIIHDPNDTRLVQGATCTWIGTMGEAPDNESGVPCCPHCGGNLLTVAGGEETMLIGFEAYELGAYTAVNPPPRPHPGYRKFMAWTRGKGSCWPSLEIAAVVYAEETGATVDPTR